MVSDAIAAELLRTGMNWAMNRINAVRDRMPMPKVLVSMEVRLSCLATGVRFGSSGRTRASPAAREPGSRWAWSLARLATSGRASWGAAGVVCAAVRVRALERRFERAVQVDPRHHVDRVARVVV